MVRMMCRSIVRVDEQQFIVLRDKWVMGGGGGAHVYVRTNVAIINIPAINCTDSLVVYKSVKVRHQLS